MEAIRITKQVPVKAIIASGRVKISSVPYWAFAANDARVYRGCGGCCAYDALVELFPGQYFDSESNLHYNLTRYYDSQGGRYTQADFIGLNGGINPYGYVYQNPLGYYDPDGKIPVPVFTAAVGAVASAAVTMYQGGSPSEVLRSAAVGAATGFFGGIGFGTKTVAEAVKLGGSGVGSTIGSILGGLIGNALTGVDIVSQANAEGGCD